MADTEDRTPQQERAPGERPEVHRREAIEPDRVDIRAVVWTGAVLAGITLVSLILVWFLFLGLKGRQEARDPRPMPVREAVEPVVPPGPRLQSSPEEDLRRMRRHEEVLLGSYSLIEGEEGFIRIPIVEAMDLALERGLGQPRRTEPPADPAGAGGTPSDERPVEGSGSQAGPDGSVDDGSPSEGTPSHTSEPTRSR